MFTGWVDLHSYGMEVMHMKNKQFDFKDLMAFGSFLRKRLIKRRPI